MLSYRKISKEIGHNGERHYPTLDKAESLLENLRERSTLEDYKEALRYYRFLPVAQNEEEVRIIHVINSALIEGKKSLGIQAPKLTFNPPLKTLDLRLKNLISLIRLKWRVW